MQDRTPPTSREETFEELRRAPFSSLEPQLRPGAPPQHIRAATKRLLRPEFRRPPDPLRFNCVGIGSK